MTLTELTPLELNKFRFSGNHTPLTPDQIEQLRKSAKAKPPTQTQPDAQQKHQAEA